jgi:hypothetical protein
LLLSGPRRREAAVGHWRIFASAFASELPSTGQDEAGQRDLISPESSLIFRIKTHSNILQQTALFDLTHRSAELGKGALIEVDIRTKAMGSPPMMASISGRS